MSVSRMIFSGLLDDLRFFCIASTLAGCVSADRSSGSRFKPSNVQIGKASYNQRTRDFEKPWPFGQLPGPGVDQN
jgi:hypothetical protein